MALFGSRLPAPAPPDTTRVVLWNLRHGGGNTRTPEQALYLLSLRPDIVVATECRTARGVQLASMLAPSGLGHATFAPAPADRINRVAVFSREPITDVASPSPRLLTARLASGLQVVASHVPDESNPQARAALWHLTLEAARRLASERCLVAGDFNTSRRGIDPPRPRQTCERHLGTLASLGYVDAWRPAECDQAAHMVLAPWSWSGPQGERHRLDAIYASAALAGDVENAVYDTTCVSAGLSDHACVITTITASRSVDSLGRRRAPTP